MGGGGGSKARRGAAGSAGRVHAGLRLAVVPRLPVILRLLFAMLLLVNGIAAFVQAGNAAGLRWNAVQVEGLVAAGVLCEHESGQAGPSAPDQSPSHPCCADCIACPCADGMLAPPPVAVALGAAAGFHLARADLPAAQLAIQLPFKRGPPPRAPPFLVNAITAA